MLRTTGLDNANGRFTDGNPQTGYPATVVDARFLNGVQESICRAIEAAGLICADDDTQLTQAIQKLGGNGVLSASGWYRVGGIILQWGAIRQAYSSEQSVPVTFPTTFPNAVFNIQTTVAGDASNDLRADAGFPRTTSGFTAVLNSTSTTGNPSSAGFDFLAIGY